MRAVFGLVLLVGMGLAGFAVYLVNQHFAAQEAALAEAYDKANNVVTVVDVYSPVRDLTYGERLTKDDVQLIKYAEANLPEGVFRTEEELFPEGINVPRVVTVPVRVNEPIVEAKVTRPGAPQGITALLDPGMRAFPLPDEMTRAFAGELRIRDFVDMYWVGNVGDALDISRLVKSRLEIIAIEAPDADGNGGGRGVVLQVSPEDFADLRALDSAGQLSITPVGSSDETTGDAPAISTNVSTVLGIVEEEEEEEEEICFVTRRVGTERIQEEVPCTE
ncbi:Flp pilus assembly protein CpaB [Yoonia sp. BS5-3]|uniref:Flp pilus assembly protein CpaB n=1 Tax=Yoonia phaeophyticola TaxID=3137369 RepID=A0ABZ2V384_9RHOB